MPYEDKDFTQFHGKGLGEERKRIPTCLFRAWYKDRELMQLKSTGDDWFAAYLTAKYGGLKFHDIDGPLSGFSSAVTGFPLEDKCCVLWRLNEDASEKPIKEYGYKYYILICFPENKSTNRIIDSLQDIGVFKRCTRVVIFTVWQRIIISSIRRKLKKWVRRFIGMIE